MGRLEESYDAFPRIESVSRGAEESRRPREKPGRRLLYAARLLRDPDRYVARFGRAAREIMLGD